MTTTSAKWQVYLGRSSDLSIQADVTPEARSKQLTISKNKPGSFTFNLPFQTEYKQYLEPIKNCIIVRKNNKVVWSGPIWSREENFVDSKFSLSAVGWFQLVHRRYLTDADVTYTDINEGQIAFNLLEIANTQTIDSVVRPTWIIPGINTSTHNRTLKYNRWQNIGQEIEGLTNIEASFDFEIHPETREMNISEWDDYEDNTDVIFGLNWGPRNVADVTRSVNADDMHNQYYISGKFAVAEAHEGPSVDVYNLHQEAIQLNEVSDNNILGAIANAELAVNQNPRVTITFLPMAEGSTAPNVPRIFEDFNLGDKVYLTAKSHGVEIIEQGIRVFGASIEINDLGLEHITQLETTYQAA